MRGLMATGDIAAANRRGLFRVTETMKLTVISVISLVCAAALIGGVFGGLFGLFAGKVAPQIFENLVPWEEQYEPVGTATVFGAFGGVMLGGGLGVFAVIVQFFASLVSRRRDGEKA